MKLFRKLGTVLLIVAVMVAFSPLSFDGGEAYAASLKLSKKTVYMSKGKTYKLKVKGISKRAAKKAKWKSSNTKIVKVSKSGKLTAKNYGSATITAKIKGKKLKCKVRVERSSEKKARKLRDYILDKGKKIGSTYYIQKKVTDPDEGEGTTWVYSISASKKDKVLTFSYDVGSEEPPDYRSIEMKIDLISGSKSLKTGTVEYYYEDGYGDETWEKTYADINTGFYHTYDTSGEADLVKGLTITKFEENEGENTTTITDHSQLATDAYQRPISVNITRAFQYWDKLMSSKKTLKKAKIKMSTIGFSKIK